MADFRPLWERRIDLDRSNDHNEQHDLVVFDGEDDDNAE